MYFHQGCYSFDNGDIVALCRMLEHHERRGRDGLRRRERARHHFGHVVVLRGRPCPWNIHVERDQRKLHNLRHEFEDCLDTLQLGEPFEQNVLSDSQSWRSRKRRFLQVRELHDERSRDCDGLRYGSFRPLLGPCRFDRLRCQQAEHFIFYRAVHVLDFF